MKDTKNIKFSGYPKLMRVWDEDVSNSKIVYVLAERLDDHHQFPFIAIDISGESNSYSNAEDIEEPEERKFNKQRTIKDGLEFGDIIKNNNSGYINKVLGICNDAIFLSLNGDLDNISDNIYTLQELIKCGYEIETKEQIKNDVIQMTVSEVSKLVGCKVEIVE